MKDTKRDFIAAGLVLLLSCWPCFVSSDEIAKELANPNTALTSLKLQSQYFSFDGDLPGADDLDMLKLFLQPTLPFPLANGYTLWVRPAVPFIIDQPTFDAEDRKLKKN